MFVPVLEVKIAIICLSGPTTVAVTVVVVSFHTFSASSRKTLTDINTRYYVSSFSPVWPNNGLKSNPMSSKVAQKNNHCSFYLKAMFSKHPESYQIFGLLLKDIVTETFQ